jgi:hypothetical protein
MTTLDQIYEDIDLWMVNYREAHSEDTRDDLEVFLDETVYHSASPYWPLRDVNGTLVDFHVPSEEREA